MPEESPKRPIGIVLVAIMSGIVCAILGAVGGCTIGLVNRGGDNWPVWNEMNIGGLVGLVVGVAIGFAIWEKRSATQTPDYEYHGLMATTWDLLRGDTSNWPDRFFYREMIDRHGQPVLDVGCGTGRLLLDYLSEGIDIEGVDNSPEMLDLCRQKAAQAGFQPWLYHRQMELMQLPRAYRTILVPSSSFQLLVDSRQAREAMHRFFAHLLPGGALVMPFMQLWKEGDPLETSWVQIGEKVRPEDGAVVRRWSKTRFDPEEGCEHTEDRYEVLKDGKVVAEEHHRRSPATRSYTQRQAAAVYEEAGFVSLQMYHEFSYDPAQPTDTVFAVVGIRPGS